MKLLLSSALSCLVFITAFAIRAEEKLFRAGAATVDISPEKLPVIINGSFEERKADRMLDPLMARALILDDGATRIAIVVVDSCMLPRTLCDEVKEIAAKSTGIPTERMLISATHTHSAPSSMGCLGSRPDETYQKFLVPKLVSVIEAANGKLVPAKVGWATAPAPDFTANRRWIRRPDKMLVDPFGDQNVRANMHPGHMSPDALGPSGPIDPELSMLSVQTRDGKPLAFLANYSMHYFGSGAVSADYFGKFAQEMGKRLAPGQAAPEFVAMMSQGTSGDLYWADYSKPARKRTIDEYTNGLATIAQDAYQKITHQDWVPLKMSEAKLTLSFRVGDEKRIENAKKTVEAMGDRLPKTKPEIYAKEQLFLQERPKAELKLQALRIGDLGITGIPNEVYAITGLKLKAQSPLKPTFNMELANGSEGYIPPPEQHKLGGYTTWPARTAGLEPNAEPQIVEALLKLLEDVSGKPRTKIADNHGDYAKTVLASKPQAYWRLNDIVIPSAVDASPNGNHARYEDFVALYLEGSDSPKFNGDSLTNRAPHLAGGRISAQAKLGTSYSVEMWIWNALPTNLRPVTGYFFSRGENGAKGAPGDHLGIGGSSIAPGRLIFFNGDERNQVLEGKTELPQKTWTHVLLVRDGKKVSVYLNGNPTPEISGEADVTYAETSQQLFIGGRNDNFANFEGKIDEVSIYDRALTSDEATQHFKAAAIVAPQPEAKPAAKLDSSPKSPAESINAMRIRDGFKVELLAAEPLIADPVAFDWGPDGKLWVAEMADYPLGMDGKMQPGGRIRVLEDTNSDGVYDKSTIFMDGVRMPNGVLVWRDGVLITAAPDIIFAKDSDGDGKADVKKVLFTGFKEGNPQLRVNGLRWGLDNWVYCANGWSNGVAKSSLTGQTLDLNGRDFRFNPDDGRIEAQAGVTQFGRERDDWGNWFGVNNSFPLWHYVLADQYTRRNPHVAPPDPIKQLMLPRNPKIYAISPPEKRFHSFDQAGRFTSACSAMIYRDDLLFSDGIRHAFMCEPFHSLVHHEIVTDDGVSFSSRRADEEIETEFLASSDRWFRPVMVRTGPDGALWIADMCRYMIEHPDWLPPEGKAETSPTYRAGEENGRIYRMYPKDKAPRPIPRFDKMSLEQLVAALDSSNGWQRDAVQRMLVWRADKVSIPLLEKLAAESTRPQTRAQALCTLDGLAALKPEHLIKALSDAHPGVRGQALRLAEPLGKTSPELIEAATKLVGDPDAKVRMQLACTLGEWPDARAGKALGQLAITSSDDAYLAGSVMTSALPHSEAVTEEILSAGGKAVGAYFASLLNLSLASGKRDVTARLVKSTLPDGDQYSAEQFDSAAVLLDAIARRKTQLIELKGSAQDALSKELQKFDAAFAAARKVAADKNAEATRRASAAKLLGREKDKRAEDVQILSELLTPQTTSEIQRAGVKAIAHTGTDDVPATLLRGWRSHMPATRGAIVDELLSRDAWALDLLKRIEAKEVSVMDIDAQRRDRLLKHKSEPIKKLAASVFAAVSNPDRQKVIDNYANALTLKGDSKNGAQVFSKSCAVCHKFDGVGNEIGPDLRSVTAHAPEKLLSSILDPNRSIEPGFTAFLCTLNDGVQVYGIIKSETANSIVIKAADNNERTILRSDIKQLRSTNVSLMPEGLEAAITPQEMADLIALLKSAPPEKANK